MLYCRNQFVTFTVRKQQFLKIYSALSFEIHTEVTEANVVYTVTIGSFDIYSNRLFAQLGTRQCLLVKNDGSITDIIV